MEVWFEVIKGAITPGPDPVLNPKQGPKKENVQDKQMRERAIQSNQDRQAAKTRSDALAAQRAKVKQKAEAKQRAKKKVLAQRAEAKLKEKAKVKEAAAKKKEAAAKKKEEERVENAKIKETARMDRAKTRYKQGKIKPGGTIADKFISRQQEKITTGAKRAKDILSDKSNYKVRGQFGEAARILRKPGAKSKKDLGIPENYEREAITGDSTKTRGKEAALLPKEFTETRPDEPQLRTEPVEPNKDDEKYKDDEAGFKAAQKEHQIDRDKWTKEKEQYETDYDEWNKKDKEWQQKKKRSDMFNAPLPTTQHQLKQPEFRAQTQRYIQSDHAKPEIAETWKEILAETKKVGEGNKKIEDGVTRIVDAVETDDG